MIGCSTVMNAVLTSLDLQDVASGGELVLAPGTLVTPLARDDAAQRGIHLRVAAVRQRERRCRSSCLRRAVYCCCTACAVRERLAMMRLSAPSPKRSSPI